MTLLSFKGGFNAMFIDGGSITPNGLSGYEGHLVACLWNF